MVQRKKAEVRGEIVAAALSLFAEAGFEGTSISAVAARAGVSTGNVYRYFSSKDELFAAAIPVEFAGELRRMTLGQIEALHATPDRELDSISSASAYAVLSDELVEHSLAHRERVVVLLARGHGTPLASFEAELRRDLVEWAFAFVKVTWPRVRVTASLRFAVDRIYRSFIASLAAAFIEHDDPRRIREVVDHLRTHHRGGLRTLFRSLQGNARKAPR